MSKIAELTREQKKTIVKYQKKYRQQAISVEPANRRQAETAVRRIAEIGGTRVYDVVWVSTPKQGKAKYDIAWTLFQTSFETSFEKPLVDITWRKDAGETE